MKSIGGGGMILPNVSLTVDNNTVHYNPYVPETRLVAKFNVTDTTNPTQICYSRAVSKFNAIEIDGVVQPSVVSSYTFSTTGEHTVKYTLTDPTTIGSETLNSCRSLTSVTIPNSVTTIGSGAFFGCSGLTSVTIPNSVTSIEANVFYECTSLTSIAVPNSVTSFGNTVFFGCSSLTSVHITDIAAWCNINFWDSDSNPLSQAYHLYMNGSEITDLVIPNSVTSIGNYAFYGCSGLTSITIPNSATSIGYGAFDGCSGLTSVEIPNSVTSIMNNAFGSCRGLISVTIPASVTSVGNGAFRRCSGLASIISNATTAPTIASNTFREVKTGGTLTVPTGSTGYDVWMGTGNYYLGKYNWTKVEQ